MKSILVFATIFAFVVFSVNGRTPYRDCNFLCPAVFMPVCGTDGNTYSNACELSRADCRSPQNIKVRHTGACYCFLPPVVGPCRARLPRYFYNPRTRECELFFYGGCSGNRNNFQTKQACEEACKQGRS